MGDVTRWLDRLSDFAHDICDDAANSLKNLVDESEEVEDPKRDTILDALRNITDECNPQEGEDINHDLLNWVAYHIEGTVLTIIGVLGIFGKLLR